MRSFLLGLCFLGSNLVTVYATNLTVTNTNDSGAGSLRQAIADAASGDTIDFDLPAPSIISLTNGDLVLDKNLTIIGPGAPSLTIERDPAEYLSGIIEIESGHVVVISGITITRGNGVNGAIYNRGTLTLQSCVVSGNIAYDLGFCAAGICNTGDLTVLDSTISGNASGSAPGGIASSGAIILTNCTISGNTIGSSSKLEVSLNPPQSPGGGLFISAGSAVLTNCTISNNFALFGGDGIYVGGASLELRNTIIAGNGLQDISGSATSLGYNLIGNGDGATITAVTGDQIGTTDSPVDAMLGPLQDNGGPTATQALLPGSPAIDKGGAADGVTTDQRGRFRPVDDPSIAAAEGGDNSDIGAFEVQAAQPLNISTRASVLTGENILDGGFIITGTDPKQVLIRGLGPSLTQFMVPGVLADPVLELHDSSGLLATNDNWQDSQETEIEATGIPPSDPAESAMVATLPAGDYTAILAGKDGGTGVGLIEVYDLDPTANSTLGNVSTRGFVGTTDDVMIGGFITGSGEGVLDHVIVRALGPSLAAQGITAPLADPTIELHDQNGVLIVFNDNWKDTQKAEIEATGFAPSDDLEAAIVLAVADGPYTAIVRGANDTVGVGLVEIYDLH